MIESRVSVKAADTLELERTSGEPRVHVHGLLRAG
jgi:hypothetical protein